VLNVSSSRKVLYTGWICARLNVQDIMNQPGTIEFTVSDCQPSAHFGTVYVDNICGTICSAPQLGALSLDPTNINCPDIQNNTPFQVCGTYQTPLNATLSTISLDVTQAGIGIATISVPTLLTANTFCFTVSPSVFGANPSGNFEFEVNATFDVNCSSGIFHYDISDESANVGPDVTFNNCCVPTLTLTSPADDLSNLATPIVMLRERSDWIKASNIISVGNSAVGNGVVYHAENFVELNPGFDALFGSQFSAYPEGCSGSYTYKNEEENNHQVIQAPVDETINLTRISREFSIVPNPSSDIIDVIVSNGVMSKISITTIDGKVVYEENIEKAVKNRLMSVGTLMEFTSLM